MVSFKREKTTVADQVSVVLADDYPVVRKGLKASIERRGFPEGDRREAGADGEGALKLIRTLRPQLAVLDVDMPKLGRSRRGEGGDQAETGDQGHHPFVSQRRKTFFRAALSAGAKGYLSKESAMDEIVGAIRAVLAGKTYLSSAIALQLLQSDQTAKTTAENPLTAGSHPVGRRILKLIADGLSTRKSVTGSLSITP